MDEPMEKTWNTEDVDFDRHARLEIKNKNLKRAIMEQLLGERGDAEGTLVIHGTVAKKKIGKLCEDRENIICGIQPLGPRCPNPSPVDKGCLEIRPDIQVKFIQKPEE
jgi:hypothetical protein